MTARRLNWILLILLVPALIVALFSTGAAIWMWRHPGVVLAASQSAKTFPPELRRVMRADIGAGVAEARPDIEAYVAARRRMFELMRADPLDEAALKSAMVDVRDAVARLQQHAQDRQVEILKSADPELRAKISLPENDLLERIERFTD
jgi:uncharacterized membrane protein